MEDITVIGYDSFIAHTDKGDKRSESLGEHMANTLFELKILVKDNNYIEGIIYLLKEQLKDDDEKVTDSSILHIIKLFYMAVEYHDMGKIGNNFQKKVGNDLLKDAPINSYSTNHTLEGALIYLMEAYDYIIKSNIEVGKQTIFIESMVYIFAEIILAHHGNLINMGNLRGKISNLKGNTKAFKSNFSNYKRIDKLVNCIENDYFVKRIDRITKFYKIYDVNTYILKYICNFLMIKSDNLATSSFSNSKRLVKNDIEPVNLMDEGIFNKDMRVIKHGKVVTMNGNLVLSRGNKVILDGEYYKLSEDLEEKYSYTREIEMEKPYVEKYLEKNLLLSPMVIMDTQEIINTLFGRGKWDSVKRDSLYQSSICLSNIFENMDYRDKSKIFKIMCGLSKIMLITFIFPEDTTFPENKVTESDKEYFRNSGSKVLDDLTKSTYYIIPFNNITTKLTDILDDYDNIINFRIPELRNNNMGESERYSYRQLLISNAENLIRKYSNGKVRYARGELGAILKSRGYKNIGKFILENEEN